MTNEDFLMPEHQGFLYTPTAAGDFVIPTKSLAATDDPATSKAAAKKAVESGKVKGHAAIVLRYLIENPNCTWGELFAKMSPADQKELREPQQVLRRLDTLKKMGLAEKGIERTCTVRGTDANEWRAVA